jgi:chemotaxis protein histidine kinase CheA
MSHLSQTLERLIEIISVEKLVGLIEKNTNESPIISPKSNISQSNITVKDYSDDIAKIQEQLVAINSSLLSLSEAIKNVVIGNNECKYVANPDTNPDAKVVEEEHIRLNIEEKVCCLPTVADTISEIVDNMNDKDISEAKEDISEAEEEEEEAEAEEEEVGIESEEDEEVELESEDISEAKEEVELESEDISEAKEVEESKEKEAEESEEEVEEEDISEANEEEEEVEESEEEVEEEDISEANEEEANEEEEEVFEIEIDDVTYYATSEENGILYAVDKDGEVGKQVGIIKDGEPIFS